MELIQNKPFFIHFIFILLISFLCSIQNEIQFQYETNLIVSDRKEYDQFGISVSISNDLDIILIGSPNSTVGNNTSQGKAYIFGKDGTNWNEITILNASDGQEYSYFGTSVSISNDGNILLIGAPFANVGSNNEQGKAYIFQNNGTKWNQIQILNANDGQENDYFGSSISISNDGDILLIGAPSANVGSNNEQGKAYIFQNNGTIWNQIQILTSSDGQAYNYFGNSVSISNDSNILLIGAPSSYEGYGYNGKAYIFQKNGNEWNQIQILIANDGQQNDNFGTSVSISNDGNILLIGAPYAKLGNNKQGKAYIFENNGTFWNQIQMLTEIDGQQNDNFGYSVSISNDGNILLIGSSGTQVGENLGQGQVYIYQRNENKWDQTQILTASDGKTDDNFGTSVSISGHYSVIGSPNHDSNKGEIYLFFETNVITSSSSSNSKTTIIVISTVIPIVVILSITLIILYIKKKRKKEIKDEGKEMKKWILKEDK